MSDVLVSTPSQGRASKNLTTTAQQTQDLEWKICQERYIIGTGGERESGKSVLEARFDDDDDDDDDDICINRIWH